MFIYYFPTSVLHVRVYVLLLLLLVVLVSPREWMLCLIWLLETTRLEI